MTANDLAKSIATRQWSKAIEGKQINLTRKQSDWLRDLAERGSGGASYYGPTWTSGGMTGGRASGAFAVDGVTYRWWAGPCGLYVEQTNGR